MRQDKKNGPNERTDQSSRKNTTKQQRANLSDAQFKTLVIKTLTELVEFVRKLDEKMKPSQEKQRKMYREPIAMRRKLGLKSLVWTRRKKLTFNQNRMKKQ